MARTSDMQILLASDFPGVAGSSTNARFIGSEAVPPLAACIDRNEGAVRLAFHMEEAMAKLITASRLPNPDAAYVALVEARRGLNEEAAATLDAKLVLILANHIGDIEVLKEAIALAKDSR